MTLITGDRVEVRRGTGPDAVGGSVRIHPGPGRGGIGFTERQTKDGRLLVVPSDAMPLLAQGRLDQRLFDVTALLEHGYGDAARKDLPLIVAYAKEDEARRAARREITAAGADLTRNLRSLRGGAVRLPKARAGDLWQELTGELEPARGKGGTGEAGILGAPGGIAKVWLDGPVRASLDRSAAQIGAPAAWEAGLTGEGVTVAVLDSGIDETHPDLDDAVVAARDFTGTSGPGDYFGHGTHVGSIITGDGDASGGTYRGVAPDADLLVGKVLDDGGFGYDSQIIAGMEWAAANGAQVVNLSLGGCATDGTDPMSRAVDRLTEETGTLFVVAAGNHPSDPFCFHDEVVSTPAAADRALAVGSVGLDDGLSEFSNTGPRLGDSAVKPELTAPGEGIAAARAAEGTVGEPVDEHYTRLSGTSMAAPHVAGAAALLAEQHPDWQADELRAALLASAKWNPGHTVFQQGAGRVDVASALDQQVTTEPAILSLGRAAWPHDDDRPTTRTVTYRNAGDAAVTLDLTTDGSGPDGEPAPAGMFTVSPARITVSAGGSAEVEVTADTTLGGPDGHYSGRLVASRDGEPVAATVMGIDQEVESYDLTIEAVDRAGRASAAMVEVTDTNAGWLGSIDVGAGEPATLRLPAGRYDLSTAVFTEPMEGEDLVSITLVTRPDLLLDGDTTVTLDARDGLPAGAEVDSPAAEPVGEQAAWVETDWLRYRIRGGDDPNSAADLYAVPTRQVPYPYTFGFTGALVEPPQESVRGRAWRDAPRGYLLHLTEQGRIPDPPEFRVRDRDLAEVRTTLHGEGVDTRRSGRLTSWRIEPGGYFGVPLGYEVQVPSRRIDFYSGGPDLVWATELATDQGYEIDYYGGDGRRYEPGKRQAKHWGRAAIGPSARPNHAYDRLWASVGEFSSSATGQHTDVLPEPGIVSETTLWKDGELVGTNQEVGGGTFPGVPLDETADYEMAVEATRDVDWSNLATRVSARWTFEGPFVEFERAPVLNLRIAGHFDLRNRAPARPFPLRLRVENADGSEPTVERIGLEASFDDGETWTGLRLSKRPDGTYRALVPRPPDGVRFVSLRGFASDAGGHEVEQTVIRAYQLKR